MNEHVDLAAELHANPGHGVTGVVPECHLVTHGVDRFGCGSFGGARELRMRLGFLGQAMRIDNVAPAFVSASSTSSGAVRRYVTDIGAVVDEELGEVAPETERRSQHPSLDRP